jgi:hypothetical protein
VRGGRKGDLGAGAVPECGNFAGMLGFCSCFGLGDRLLCDKIFWEFQPKSL